MQGGYKMKGKRRKKKGKSVLVRKINSLFVSLLFVCMCVRLFVFFFFFLYCGIIIIFLFVLYP